MSSEEEQTNILQAAGDQSPLSVKNGHSGSVANRAGEDHFSIDLDQRSRSPHVIQITLKIKISANDLAK